MALSSRLSSAPVRLLVTVAVLVPSAAAQLVFEPPVAANGGNLPVRSFIGDLDEDGHPDLVCGHLYFDPPTLSLGLGGGQFGPPQSIPPLDTAPGVAGMADFNGDGHLDLLGFAGQASPFTASVLLGTGHGDFQPAVGINSDDYGKAFDADVGDFDGDGALDVALSNGPFSFFLDSAILAVFGDGEGGFAAPVLVVGPAEFPPSTVARVRVGDTNGDGFDDIVYTTGVKTRTMLSQGDGSFVTAACGPGGCAVMSDSDWVLADVNADGREDIVTNARVMPAQPDGTFGLGQVFPPELVPVAVDLGDLDGDGLLDVVIGRHWVATVGDPEQMVVGDVLLLRGNGDGSFQTPGLVVSHVPVPRGVTIADVDVDGRADVVVSEFQLEPASVRVLINHTYGHGSPFLDLGGALAGSNGSPIQLAGGTLVAGQPFSFQIANGPPNGAAYHVVGLSRIDAPFKGGVMLPSLNLINGPFGLDASGSRTLAGTWPAGAAGLTLYLQFWMPHGGGPAGLVASSGVRAQIP